MSRMSRHYLLSVLLVFVYTIVAESSYLSDVYPKAPVPQLFARFAKEDDSGKPLFLTPLIENGRINEARTKAAVQYKEMEETSSYSGFLTVNKQYNSNLFFWFFPAKHNPRNAPVILWLQGGPGISSMIGVFLENGPFFVTKNDTVVMRNYTWNTCHNVLYIDNPVGTGYSFTENENGYATNDSEVGRDVHAALVQFFQLFPELRNNDFYISGESYAGKFVPAVGYTIKNQNVRAQTKINLKGLLIGSGLTDPVNQIDYGDLYYQLGLVDLNGRNLLYRYENRTKELVQQGKYLEAYASLGEMLSGNETTPSVIKTLTDYNSLVNLLQTNDNTDGDGFISWVQTPEVRRALHVGDRDFNIYNGTSDAKLKGDFMRSLAPIMPELIQNYKVLLYNGQLDILVAYVQTEKYVQNLKWAGAERYKTAPRKFWHVEGELAGYTKTVDSFTEVLVRNAGHLPPMDQPKWMLDLVTRFTQNKPFN